MDPSRKIVRVEIEYDDGDVMRAEGEDADTIWRAYGSALDFYLNRQGRSWDGPVMQRVVLPPSAPLAAACGGVSGGSGGVSPHQDKPLSLRELAEMSRRLNRPNID